MTRDVSWFDRVRIERVVWSLDQRLYDLPCRSRIEKWREVRANLLTAAHDVGARAALRQLGDSRRLALGYLDAEFGDDPRPSWIAGGLFLASMPLALNWLMAEAMFGFRDGVLARDPHATGTFVWKGLPYVQSSLTYALVDGKGDSVGGAWTPLLWALLVVGTVLAGRLWRVPMAWRRRRSRLAGPAPA